MSQGTASFKRNEHENDAEKRIEEPHPIEHQEHGHDQGQHRKGVQHQQRSQHRGAGRKLETRQVIGSKRGYGQDDHGLRAGDQQRVAEGFPDARELDCAADHPGTGAHDRGEIRFDEKNEISRVQVGADQQRERSRSNEPNRRDGEPHLTAILRQYCRQPERNHGGHEYGSRAPQDYRVGDAGLCRKRDRNEPEIGQDDRQRNGNEEGVEGGRLGPPQRAGAGRQPVPIAWQALQLSQCRHFQCTSMRGRCNRRCRSKKRQPSSATATPITMRKSASAAP